MESLSEEVLTQIFDQLVSEGVIVYGPHSSIRIQDEGYPMEFRICPALATKPHTVGAPNTAFHSSRKWGPGSDMYCPDERLIVTQLNHTHDLALNLFCVDRPQLLLLTLDSYRRQHEPLDAADLMAALQILRTFPSMYVIFNCGEQGGCSRVHKHLQGLKGPPAAFDLLISKHRSNQVPFVYFAQRIDAGFATVQVDHLLLVYRQMLDKCREALELEPHESSSCPPHNVVMWDNWIIVLPRRKGGFESAAANAGGMLGSVWVQGQEQVDVWLRLGCANVLRELGVPAVKKEG